MKLSTLAIAVAILLAASSTLADDIPLGDAANFAVLYEGNGKNQLSTTNVTINGNIGIGDPSGMTTSSFAASGPGTVNGNVDFAGAVLDSVSNTTITGAITGGNANVQADLNSLNSLSSSLGGASGTSISINTGGSGGSQTINESTGALETINGVTYRVFTVTSLQFNNQTTLTINGDGSGVPVVFNFASNAQFGGTVNLTGGLTTDQVLFNVTGGTLQLNSNGADLTGVFLDPNGSVSVVHTDLTGRVFGGDSSNMQIVSGDTITSPSVATPEPSSFLLLAAGLLALIAFRRRAISGLPIGTD